MPVLRESLKFWTVYDKVLDTVWIRIRMDPHWFWSIKLDPDPH
jgi:hypothetical protein